MTKLTRRLKTLLPRSTFTKSVTVLAGGTAVAQVLTVLASPILTRLYLPTEFGILAVYASILGIVAVVASLRYELAIPLPKDEATADSLLMLSLAALSGVTLLVVLSVLAFGDFIVQVTGAPALRPYLWLLPLGVCGAGLYNILNFWAVREQAFPTIARTKLHQSGATVVTQLGLGFLGAGPIGLLLGHLFSQVAGVGTLLQVVRKSRPVLPSFQLALVVKVVKRYWKFPVYSSGAAFLNSASLYLPALLLASFYGPQVAGLFELLRRIINMPVTLIGNSLNQVYIGEAARLAQNDLPELKRLYKKTVARLLLLGIAPLLLLIFFGPALFALVFGEAWREAGVYAQLISVGFLARFAVSPVSSFAILEELEYALAFNALFLVLVLLGLGGSRLLSPSPRYAIASLGLSTAVAYVIMYVLNLHAMNRAQRR